ARVVPGDGEVAGRPVEGDGRHELGAARRVVVHLDRGTPGGAVVVRIPREDHCVVALVDRFVEVDEVDAAAVGAVAEVPGQVRFGAVGAAGGGGAGVPGGDVGRRDLDGGAEGERPQAVRVEVDANPLVRIRPVRRAAVQHRGNQHLAVGADGDAAEAAA